MCVIILVNAAQCLIVQVVPQCAAKIVEIINLRLASLLNRTVMLNWVNLSFPFFQAETTRSAMPIQALKYCDFNCTRVTSMCMLNVDRWTHS